MSNDTRTINASCLCGAAKHQITLPSSAYPLALHLCQCNSCRRMTGTLALTVVFLPEEYQPEQALLDKLVPFQFSHRLTQYFCKTCGAQMLAFTKRIDEDGSNKSSWDVATGTIENLEGVYELNGHEHVADTLDGGFADFLTIHAGKPVPRWPHHFEKGEQVPLRWERPDRPKIDPKPTDRLHAHCKCGGAEFWIARPSERSKKATRKWPDLLIPYHTGQQGAEGEAWWLMEDGKKFLAGMCSCNSCRLDTGMEWVEWAFIPAVDIALDEEGKKPFSPNFGTLQRYSSSHDVMRYHCGTCGATVFYCAEDRPELIDVAVGLFDAPEGARAESWLEFWCGRLSYREDAIPRAETLTLAVEKSLQEHKQWKYPNQPDEKHG